MIKFPFVSFESHTKPVNDESEATDVFEQQDKLNKAQIDKAMKNQNMPSWLNKDTTKIKSTMNYEAKQCEIMTKLGL